MHKLATWRGLLIAAMILVATSCSPGSAGTTPAQESPASAVPPAGQTSTGPSTATAPSPPPVGTALIPIFATASQAASLPSPEFSVAVIVDTRSEPVSREQAGAVVAEASRFLESLTAVRLVMLDYVEDGLGGTTSEMASRYITSHAEAVPSGLVIFSYGDDGKAKAEGGTSFAIAGLAGYRNVFASPLTGAGYVYVEVLHFSQKYAPCGYAGTETVQSRTATAGECRNQPGMACIQHNGYSMCSDSLGHLYASRPTYFLSSSMVHQLLHLFSAGGDLDHFSTPECNARMGYPAQFQDLQEDQYHNGLCPYVYDEFIKSFQP